jgi:YVTN family beta-propeller protein
MEKIIRCVSWFVIIVSSGKVNAQVSDSFHILNVFHIASGGRWDYIATGPDNNRLYVSHGTQVNILNETTGDSIGVIENTIGVHGVAFDKATNKGFTSNGKLNTVSVFDLTTDSVLTQIPTEKNPDAIFYESFSKKIITCNGHSNSLSVIDPALNKVIATIPVEGNPETAVSDDNGKMYVNIENKNEIAVINTKTFTVEKYWPLAPGEGPAGFAIDIHTNRLFSGCSDTKSLVILDAINGQVIDTIPIGAHCDGVAFDNFTKNIFASCGDGTLTVINEMAQNKFVITAKVPTKKGARTITVDEHTHLIYLPTADFETLSVTDTTKNIRPQMIPGTFEVIVVGK